jgi:predicted membrane chloride channel (bestrophin family)
MAITKGGAMSSVLTFQFFEIRSCLEFSAYDLVLNFLYSISCFLVSDFFSQASNWFQTETFDILSASLGVI